MNTVTTNMFYNGLGEIQFNIDQLLKVKALATAGQAHHTLVESIRQVKTKGKKGKTGKPSYEYGPRFVVKTTDSSFNDVITDWGKNSMILGEAKIGKTKQEFDDFSSKIFMMELDEDIAITFAQTKKPLWYSVFDGTMYRAKRKGGFEELVTNKQVSKLGSAYKPYYPLAYTTGSTRKSQMLFFRKDHKDETWLSFIEKVLPGFYTALCSKAKEVRRAGEAYDPSGKKALKTDLLISGEDFAKIFGRISLAYTSGGKVTDNLGSVAYYHGTFDEISGMSDGAALVRQSYAEGLMHLIEGEGIGLQFQPRIRRGIIKSACIATPDEMFEQKIADLLTTGKLEILGTGPINIIADRNNVKLDIESENDMKILAIGKATEGRASKQLWQKIIYAAAKKGQIIELLEYATGKGKADIDKIIENIFKRIAKKAKLGSKFGRELLTQVDPSNVTVLSALRTQAVNEIVKLINKLSLELRDDDNNAMIFNGVVTPDLVALMTGNQCVLGTDKDGKHEVYFGLISKKIGKLKKARANFEKRLADGSPDPSYYAKRLDELNKEIAVLEEKYHDCKIIKYPTVYIGEYLDAVLVDSYELEQRILANDNISDVYKKGLIHMINNGSDSVIMFESDKKVYGLLAGMDNDYDKCGIIFDKFINEILDGNQFAEINLAQDETVGGDPFNLEDTSLPIKMFNRQNDKYNTIGGITNQADKGNTAQAGLYAMESIRSLLASVAEADRDEEFNSKVKFLSGLKDCSYNVGVNILKESVGETEGIKDSYKAQLSEVFDENNKVVKTVDNAFSHRMAKEIRRVEWSEENVRVFLLDLSKIYRLYQEGIIDSAKTGMHIKRIFKATSVILVSNMELYAETNEDGNTEILRRSYPYLSAGDIVQIRDEQGKVTQEVEAIEYHDVLSIIQDELVKHFNVEFNKQMELHSTDFRYSDEDVAEFAEIILDVQSMDATAVKELVELKTAYNAIVGDKAMKMASAAKTLGDDADKAFVTIRKTYDLTFAALSNSVEDILGRLNLDAYEKGLLLLAIGCFNAKEGVINPTAVNKFAYISSPSYVFQYMFEGKKIATYGDIVVDNVDLKDKAKLNFVNGVDIANKVVLEERYTGKAVYHVTEDKHSYVQVDVKVEDIGQVKSKVETNERLVVITGSGNKEQYLLDKFEMIETGDDSEIIFQKGQLKTANEDGGWDIINADGRDLFVNTLKEKTYYKVTSSSCIYTNYNSKSLELTYVILTAKEN